MIAAGSIRSTSASAGIAANRFSANSDRTLSPRHGDDHRVERPSRAVGQNHRVGASAVAFDLPNRRAEMHRDAVVGQPLAQAIVEDLAQRPARQHQVACPARGQKAVAEDLSRGGQRGAIDRFAQGTDQHDRPEALDGPLRLAVAAEPRADGLVFVNSGANGSRCVGSPGCCSRQLSAQSTCATRERCSIARSSDRYLKPHQARQQVQRRGQPAAGREIALAALGTDEVQRVGALEAVVDAGAAAEVEKLGAAAHRDVLAVVDPFAGFRIDERSGPAAERLGLLEQFDAQPRSTAATAAASPASPPPTIATCGRDRQSRRAFGRNIVRLLHRSIDSLRRQVDATRGGEEHPAGEQLQLREAS